jgi:hypothetical protein
VDIGSVVEAEPGLSLGYAMAVHTADSAPWLKFVLAEPAYWRDAGAVLLGTEAAEVDTDLDKEGVGQVVDIAGLVIDQDDRRTVFPADSSAVRILHMDRGIEGSVPTGLLFVCQRVDSNSDWERQDWEEELLVAWGLGLS